MKQLSCLALLLLISACSQPEEVIDYAMVSGTVKNIDDAEIKFHDIFRHAEEIEVSEDGSFEAKIQLTSPAYYSVRVGDNRYNLYLSPGDELNLVADGAEEGDEPEFSGPPAEVQKYFLAKAATMDRLYDDYSGFGSKSEADFQVTIDSLHEVHLGHLNSLEGYEGFKEHERQSLEFASIGFLSDYEGMHGYFTDNDEFEASEAFLAAIPTVDLDDDDMAQLYSSYHSLAMGDYQELLETHADSNQSDALNMLAVMKMKESPALRKVWFRDILYYFDASAEDPAALRDALLAETDDADHIERINDKYESIMKTSPGSLSPTFTYLNHDGSSTSLEELAGKYVYIDVWATWCGPCVREIPSLKEVEHDFHDKNIEFVSISIDDLDDKEKWAKFVTDRELGGVQLFSDNSWQSDFIKDYAIEGIPRFILLDTEGKIITADAMRPSDPDLRGQLESLGVK